MDAFVSCLRSLSLYSFNYDTHQLYHHHLLPQLCELFVASIFVSNGFRKAYLSDQGLHDVEEAEAVCELVSKHIPNVRCQTILRKCCEKHKEHFVLVYNSTQVSESDLKGFADDDAIQAELLGYVCKPKGSGDVVHGHRRAGMMPLFVEYAFTFDDEFWNERRCKELGIGKYRALLLRRYSLFWFLCYDEEDLDKIKDQLRRLRAFNRVLHGKVVLSLTTRFT